MISTKYVDNVHNNFKTLKESMWMNDINVSTICPLTLKTLTLRLTNDVTIFSVEF